MKKILFLICSILIAISTNVHAGILFMTDSLSPAKSDLTPPVIIMIQPLLQDTVITTGPFSVNAIIGDNSGIDTAYIAYTINGGATAYAPLNLTSGVNYAGTIPCITYNTHIDYHVVAIDNSSEHNAASGDPMWFFIKKVQQITIGVSTTSNSFWGPLVASTIDTAKNYSRFWYLFTAQELSAAGLPNGAVIKKLEWYKTGAGTITGDAAFRIYMENSSLSVLTSGAIWSALNVGASEVYNSSTQTIPTAEGWMPFEISPFSYNGNALEIGTDWDISLVSGAPVTGNVTFQYTSNLPAIYTIGSVGNSSPPSSLYSAPYGGTKRANIRIIYSWGFPHDAGIYSIVPPSDVIVANTPIPLEVSLKNFGTDTLDSVWIKWSIDDHVLDSVQWHGSIPEAVYCAPFVVGNVSFPAGNHILKMWTEFPDGCLDSITLNDTSACTVYVCDSLMHGTYEIGATGDFASFNEAVAALNRCGIDGPTDFLVQNGMYTEQIIIPPIGGTSESNVITFRSMTGVNTDVTLQQTSPYTLGKFVIKLDGANYISFEEMTIKAVIGVDSNRVLELSGGASYNCFEGCILQINNSNGYFYPTIYSSKSSSDNFNRFIGNTISSGTCGAYFMASAANRERGNQFENNEFLNWTTNGINISYNDSLLILNNHFDSTTSIYNLTPVKISYCDNGTQISGNIISVKTAGLFRGIEVSNSNAISLIPNVIANNFIINRGTSTDVAGIFVSSSKHVKILNNSVNLMGRSSMGARDVFLESSSDISMLNNNLANSADGYALELGVNVSLNVSDYNNFFTTGISLFKLNAGDTCTLVQYQASMGKDLHSMNVDPGYYCDTNLHCYSVDLYHAGIPVAEITEDIDGDLRDLTTPTIGADEYTPKTVDAGISRVDSPVPPNTLGSQNISVSLTNYGTDTLRSATIHYEVNGVPGTPYLWNGNLPFRATFSNISIGVQTFWLANDTIRAWTELPNDTTDLLNQNDTLLYDFYGCNGPFSGIYTIGEGSYDLPDFTTAVEALKHCGINGPVIFNVAPGTYVAELRLDNVAGSSAVNTITFTSLSGNNNDVILKNPDSYYPTITIWNGASHFIFDHLTIKSTRSVETIKLAAFSHDLHFTHCNIEKASTAFTTSSPISGTCNNLHIEYNFIKYGYVGVSISGSDSVVIRHNRILYWQDNGIYCSGSSNVMISENYFYKTNSACRYPNINIYNCNSGNIRIEKNKIDGYYSSDGILVCHCSGFAATPILISNNFISLNNSSFSEGLVVDNSSYVNVYNNSVEIYGSNSLSNIAFALTGTFSHINILNNVFSNSAGGYAYKTFSLNNVCNSDYNDLYTSGPTLGYYSGSTFTNLSGLQTLSGKDIHSINCDPEFVSNVDLHTASATLNMNATPLALITNDIDNENRDPNFPDIGADEFDTIPDLRTYDAGIAAILLPDTAMPTEGSVMMTVRIQNYGTRDLTNIPLGFSIDSIAFPLAQWSGILPAGSWTDFVFPQSYYSPFDPYMLCAFTLLPNDIDSTNDRFCNEYQSTMDMNAYNQNGFFLFQNEPNPASSHTSIKYSIPISGQVIFELRNLLGQIIFIRNEEVSSGIHSLSLNLHAFDKGLYYYTLSFEGQRLLRKMVIK